MATQASTGVTDARRRADRREPAAERAPDDHRASRLRGPARAWRPRSSSRSCYAILGGFKTNGQLAANPVAILPDPWVFTNYTDVLFGENAATFWRQLSNSVVVAAIAVGADGRSAPRSRRSSSPGSGSPAARRCTPLFVFGLLFPSAVAILPLYILVRDLGLSGNPLGVALPQAAFALPLTIVILRPFFRSIPAELEDAARIDGCGSFGFFWRVLLPLSRPALATVSVLALVATWNAFLLPLGPARRREPVDAAARGHELLDRVRIRQGPHPRLRRDLDHPGAGLLRRSPSATSSAA